MLRMIIKYAPRAWTPDDWDRLHELLGQYIEALRSGDARFIERLTTIGDKEEKTAPDLPDDDVTWRMAE
jgi:hypothetical protein